MGLKRGLKVVAKTHLSGINKKIFNHNIEPNLQKVYGGGSSHFLDQIYKKCTDFYFHNGELGECDDLFLSLKVEEKTRLP